MGVEEGGVGRAGTVHAWAVGEAGGRVGMVWRGGGTQIPERAVLHPDVGIAWGLNLTRQLVKVDALEAHGRTAGRGRERDGSQGAYCDVDSRQIHTSIGGTTSRRGACAPGS